MELGYGATLSTNTIKAVLEQLSINPSNAAQKLTDQEIGNCLYMMATSLTNSPSINAIGY